MSVTSTDAIRPIRNRNFPRCSKGEPLTQRELEVLRLMGEGLLSKQISHRMGIATKTVENHRCAISIKSGCLNQFQLGVWAAKAGLV